MHRTLKRLVAYVFIGIPAHAQPLDIFVLDGLGYQEDEYHRSFYEKHTSNPAIMTYEDEGQAFQYVIDGAKVDVVHLCSPYLTKWIDAELIEPWNSYKVKRTGFGTHAIQLSEGVEAKGIFLSPFTFGRTLPIYNSLLVPQDDVQSLNIFLNPNYSGQVSLPNDYLELFVLSLLASGGRDLSNISEEEFQNALAWLQMADANSPHYWSDYFDLSERLARGEIAVAWGWTDTGFLAQKVESAIRFMNNPLEGTAAWSCGYSRVKRQGGNSELIDDFVDARSSEDTLDILLQWGEGHHDLELMREKLSDKELYDRGYSTPSGFVMFLSPIDTEILERIRFEVDKIRKSS